MTLFAASCSREKTSDAGRSALSEKIREFKIERVKTPATDRIDTFFSSRHKKGVFNGVVLFAENGRVVYEKAFGYADFRKKEELKTNSVFQLASVSKQFTAAAVMLLKERGKLAYSDSIRKFFPHFPYENITIRQLLTHNSGLPNYMYFADEYWQDKEIPMSNLDVIRLIESYKPEPYCKPGLVYNYSNTGYSILAAIVEKVSGMPFHEFMRKEIFQPLGMNNTFVYSYSSTPQVKNIAVGYDGGRRPVDFNYQNGVVGDKGVYSTVEDMLRWDQALYKGYIVGRSSLTEAFTPAYRTLRDDHNYGYGWRIITKEDNRKIVYHGGWWKGYRSYFVRSLDDQRTIIVLINVASHVPFRIKELLELY